MNSIPWMVFNLIERNVSKLLFLPQHTDERRILDEEVERLRNSLGSERDAIRAREEAITDRKRKNLRLEGALRQAKLENTQLNRKVRFCSRCYPLLYTMTRSFLYLINNCHV